MVQLKARNSQKQITALNESHSQLTQRFNELHSNAQLIAQKEAEDATALVKVKQELLEKLNALEQTAATQQQFQALITACKEGFNKYSTDLQTFQDQTNIYKTNVNNQLNALESTVQKLAKQKTLEESTIINLINQHNESSWIERGALTLGGVAAFIANRKYSANVSALIGFGTTATAYTLAQLSRSKK